MINVDLSLTDDIKEIVQINTTKSTALNKSNIDEDKSSNENKNSEKFGNIYVVSKNTVKTVRDCKSLNSAVKCEPNKELKQEPSEFSVLPRAILSDNNVPSLSINKQSTGPKQVFYIFIILFRVITPLFLIIFDILE